MISFKSEMNLHLTVLFVCHKNHTSRSVEHNNVTVPNICALKKQQEMESDKKTSYEDPKIDLKDVSKTYEAIIQYLCGIHVCDGFPL